MREANAHLVGVRCRVVVIGQLHNSVQSCLSFSSTHRSRQHVDSSNFPLIPPVSAFHLGHGISFAPLHAMDEQRERVMHKFKRCSFCGKEWVTREEFLADKEVRLEGYQWDSAQVVAGLPPDGLLVFSHSHPGCGTSISIAARTFKRDFQQPHAT